MTVDEFLDWDSDDNRIWQLVDGTPQAMAPAKRTHDALQGELGFLIQGRLPAQDSPCSIVVTTGVVPHLRGKHNMGVPNSAVAGSDHQAEEAALTDPVLVTEILSPSDRSETWPNVWARFTSPGVREILVLSSFAVGAAILRRRADGTWPKEPETIPGGDLILESTGLQILLADVYRTARLRRPPGGG